MRKNIIESKTSPYYRFANPILQAALNAVDPYECARSNLKAEGGLLRVGSIQVRLDAYEHIYLIGSGKAVLPMALAAHEGLGDRIGGGFLIGKHRDKQIQAKLSSGIIFSSGSHPIPNEKSVTSTKNLVSFLGKVTKKDLVICLISGGGSALMCLPYEPISLEDMQATTRQLLFSGATINELNVIRKHLDQVKGGGLARLIAPARLVTLVLSDVIGDALDAIASGPTVADNSTYEDALEIIERYHLGNKLPEAVIKHLNKGLAGEMPETVKTGEDCLSKSDTLIIGSLKLAAEAARKKAEEMGFNTRILDTQLHGEAREKGAELADILKNLVEGSYPLQKPACLIAGGETTVTVRGAGKGGRNQETALSAASVLDGLNGCLFVSLATDGEDGPTDAAGAAVDGDTLEKGRQAGMDAAEYLNRNDAYPYLERTGSLIMTGPTGTNVNDLVLLFAFSLAQKPPV